MRRNSLSLRKMPLGCIGERNFQKPLDFFAVSDIVIDDATGLVQCQETSVSGAIAVVSNEGIDVHPYEPPSRVMGLSV